MPSSQPLDKLIEFEQGEIDPKKVNFINPFYTIKVDRQDPFYNECAKQIKQLPGTQKNKYQQIKKRLGKFYVPKTDKFLDINFRWNRKIQPNYSDFKTYTVSHTVLTYGLDYLSNKQISKLLDIPKNQLKKKRINMSNIVFTFQSNAEIQKAFKPHLFDQDKTTFFIPKAQQESQENNPVGEKQRKMPRKWFKLKPYNYKEGFIEWEVRYLTNKEFQNLQYLVQNQQFKQIYEISKKQWSHAHEYQKSLRTSALSTSRSHFSRKPFSYGSNYSDNQENEKRQRSRQKIQKKQKNILQGQNVKLKQFKENDANFQNSSNEATNIDQYHQEQSLSQISFVYNPPESKQKKIIESIHTKENQKLLKALQNLDLQKINRPSNLIQDSYIDEDTFVVDGTFKKNKNPSHVDETWWAAETYKPTEVEPGKKFNYQKYTEEVLQAQQEARKTKTKYICID